MSKKITKSGDAYFYDYPSSKKSSPSKSFSPVLDAGGQPIRSLWKKGNVFYARLSLSDESGRKAQRRIRLKAGSVIHAQAELEKLRERGFAPNRPKSVFNWSEYWPRYIAQVEKQKRPLTIKSEKLHCRHWSRSIGKLKLHQIRKSDLLTFRVTNLKEGWTGRTVNLAFSVLSNVLSHAQDSGLIDTLPHAGLKPIRWKPQKRPLFTLEQIESVCLAGIEHCKNGELLADYIRLMTRCGSRATETLRLMWSDVDWRQQQITIGSDGLSKNHESRVVDFNNALASLLEEMKSRRNGSAYLFPAPRKFGEDAPARSLKESMRKARGIAGVGDFGFHDCRHYFISHAVMSGVDYMTIARWVGHKDGGVLIGRVYGHLDDEHAKHQARRLNLG